MRSVVHPAIADMIIGHGNRKKDNQSLYLSVSDADSLAAIDKMEFDHRETEIWVMETEYGKLRRRNTCIEVIPRRVSRCVWPGPAMRDRRTINLHYGIRATSQGAALRGKKEDIPLFGCSDKLSW